MLQEFEYNMDVLCKKHKGAAKYLNKLGDSSPGMSKKKSQAPSDANTPATTQSHSRPGIPGGPVPVTSHPPAGSSSNPESKPGHKHWCWAFALSAGHILDGVRTSNYAEQENHRFLPSRWKHPLYFLLDFALVFTRLVSDQVQLSREMEQSPQAGEMKAIMPAIQAKYKAAEKSAEEYNKITQTGPTSGTVAKSKEQVKPPRSLHLDVKIKDRCSCREWMNLGWQCRHSIALSRFFKCLNNITLYIQFSF
eukprot:1072367-Rhodomonas_salina.1